MQARYSRTRTILEAIDQGQDSLIVRQQCRPNSRNRADLARKAMAICWKAHTNCWTVEIDARTSLDNVFRVKIIVFGSRVLSAAANSTCITPRHLRQTTRKNTFDRLYQLAHD